jgi:gliding motility-associated-like protein
MTVVVEKFVSAAFDRSVSPICLVKGQTNAINLDGYVVNPGGYWEGDGISPGTKMFDPNYAKLGKNNKVTYYTNSAPTTSLCPDKTEIMIEVRPQPVTTAFSSLNTGCAPTEIVFNSASYTDGEGKWTFDDGTEIKTGFTVSHVFTSPGIYNATYSYKDDIGCEALPYKVKTIHIHSAPKADFTFPDEIYISNPEVQMTNLTTILGDNTYQWTIKQPNQKIIESKDVNPFVKLPLIGNYQITLQANGLSAAGSCTDQITKLVEVKNQLNVFVPSAFSPNDDGKNDFFKPVFSDYGIDVNYFEMQIFDRWGAVIFQTKDFSTKGWDGKFKGQVVQIGTYPYTIRYKDLDGKSYEKLGTVILLDN